MGMDNFIEVAASVPITPDDFMQLVRRRRSHRSFGKKQVEREALETLIEACRYSPTGSNVQSVEIMMVQDPDYIKKLSNLNVDYFDESIKEAEARAEKMKAAGQELPEDFKAALATLLSRKTLVEARDLGIDPIFHRAPAVMIFHSISPTSTPKDNCVIAAQTVTLAAMTLGLESCYIGLFEAAANAYPPLIEELALPENHQVLSVLILGYPRMKYLRTVDRRPIPVRWV
jgi:nitroreductase